MKFPSPNLILCGPRQRVLAEHMACQKHANNILIFRLVDQSLIPLLHRIIMLENFRVAIEPLTINDYNLKDTFDAVSAIKTNPQDLFDQGYCFVSFDVESLFTNVPLKRTINIVLSRVFDNKSIDTTLQKRTLNLCLGMVLIKISDFLSTAN